MSKGMQRGHRVKCFATGEFGNSLEYVYRDKHWWKNEAVYERYLKNREYRDKCYELYATILGYEQGQMFSGYVFKRFKKLEFYGWECIYNNMLDCRDDMEWAVSHKDFSNDSAQTGYLFAIMERRINICYAKMKAQRQEENRKKRMAEQAAKYVNDVDLTVVQNASEKKRDISKWLEDEE